MFPTPSINYIPKIFADAGSDRMIAFCAMIDNILDYMKQDIIDMNTFYDPARMPSQFLDELGYMLSANIYLTDTTITKRQKINLASTYKGTNGLWSVVKTQLDAITGFSASIFPVTYADLLIDENGNFLVDEFGAYLSDDPAAPAVGEIFIDLGDGGTLSPAKQAEVVYYFTKINHFAYYIINVGYTVVGVFTSYDIIT